MKESLSIICADVVDGLSRLDQKSVDVIFADPPYFFGKKQSLAPSYSISEQLQKQAWKDFYADWDNQWDSIFAYHAWLLSWLAVARTRLKPKGSIFICGTYHNIPAIGMALQMLEFYTVRWIYWFKPNAFPNRSMTNLKASTEIVIWARPGKKDTHIYQQDVARAHGGGKNLTDFWSIPFDSVRARRLRAQGFDHPSKKPPALVRRCLHLAAPQNDALIVDPFAGSGTTGEVALEMAYKGWKVVLFDNNEHYVKQMQALFAMDIQQRMAG